MKAAPFDYMRAASIEEACRALADGDGEARIIAGGQTLVPLMAIRLARPTLLIDINGIAEMSGIAVDGDRLIVGAGTRQADALTSTLVRGHIPVLAEALSHVGHDQTRNRGTIGGSLCNADPAAELPLIARLLDAEMVARTVNGQRTIPAAAFFDSAMATALEPHECLTEIRFPIWPAERTSHGFHEVSIRDSDFALAAAAAQISLDAGGTCHRLHVALGGASPAPLRLTEVETALTGTTLDDTTINAETARVAGLVEPQGDVHADAAYRRRVARVMVERAILSARDNARGGTA
ncbi:MAG: xanthine dehydrogenase family protein subunit M [Rhodospirillaceae bacterium]|jgi:CO/xanthine dehydrogenase FAD-binding subunit|nr:xanthine dehydrogenase family protein subunit M [Rhodospirillaceae bacterium]